MENTIKVKCPCCSKVLTVRNVPGIENMQLTCPICKQKSSFKAFRQINECDDGTQYVGSGNKQSDVTMDSKPQTSVVRGVLRMGTDFVFPLKKGRNVVGRKASVSSADIQIQTESKRMSREHLVIEVKEIGGRGLVYYASLYKERLNQTFIGGEQITYGDSFVLNDGDIIKLPDCILKFEILDEESTEFRG